MAPMANTQSAWVRTERWGLGGGRNGTRPFIKSAFESTLNRERSHRGPRSAAIVTKLVVV